jgi:hypothetical protein
MLKKRNREATMMWMMRSVTKAAMDAVTSAAMFVLLFALTLASL